MEQVSALFEGKSKFITFLSLCLPLTLIGEVFLRGNPLITLLAMIPANSFLRRTFTWNIFSHCLIETDVFMCILAVVLLQTWGATAVREWGAVEVGKLILGVNALVGVVIVIIAAVSHPQTMWLYEYHCGAAYTMAVIIGIIAHLAPDMAVFGAAFNELRARHCPLLFCAFSVLYSFVRKGPSPTEEEALVEVDVWRGHCSVYAPLAMWLTWLYLRQAKGGAPLHEGFFPAPVRDAVQRFGTAVGPIGRVFGIGQATAAEVLAAQHSHAMFGAPSGGGRYASAPSSIFGVGITSSPVDSVVPSAGNHTVAVPIPAAAAAGASAGPSVSAAEAKAAADAENKKQLARSALAKRLAMGGGSAVAGAASAAAVIATSGARRPSAVPLAVAVAAPSAPAAAAASSFAGGASAAATDGPVVVGNGRSGLSSPGSSSSCLPPAKRD